ncbi:MAG: Hsp70 family protein [Chloroherpetonaceae bacterium]|nr:Hsp70 family protein [Chthonomonadaceae bacterium]MDW8208975.1 Hsp70 family protein [Chloroherpetonaceae bacterium]
MEENALDLAPLMRVQDREKPYPVPPSLPMRVLGIDLGTTNSTVAEVRWDPGQMYPSPARCIDVVQPTDAGEYIHILVPSVVALYRGQVWVGEGAKRLRADARRARNKDIFYECKNDMGLQRTYHRAPEGFRHAREISGKILDFLRSAAEQECDLPPERIVVTVPASFQLAQRRDTQLAAQMAGLDLQPGDLLDEPVAAFLDYLVTHWSALQKDLERPQNLLVFDFGGGTCDVAIFRLTPQNRGGNIHIAFLAVSRYHRLGGGDIDAAIVHEVLIPQLAEQQGLDVMQFEFHQRKRQLEPALLSVAQSLKEKLCIEIDRLQKFDRYQRADKSEIRQVLPGTWPCPCDGHDRMSLQSPALSAAEFEELLEPFLDTDLLYARNTEYHLTCSIFAPIQDALDRAQLTAGDINLCLMVGGSSLIPQVQEAVQHFFPSARVLTYADREATQVAVARGAAYHALTLALFGRGWIQPVAHDTISLRTESGLFELVPQGATLPYPGAEAFIERTGLLVPQTATQGEVPLQVEVVAGTDAQERKVFAATWNIPGPVREGDPLLLRVQMDANQCLQLQMALQNRPDSSFDLVIENPLIQVVNPHAAQLRIEENEEALRTGEIPETQIPHVLRQLADDYAEIGQIDRSIDYLKQILRRLRRPDADLLNLLGIRYGEREDWEREEKMYREAVRVSPTFTGPMFNLALSQFRRNQFEEAEATIRQALAIEKDPPYMVLLAQILRAQGKTDQVQPTLEEALQLFGSIELLTDWELGWFLTAASQLNRQDLASAARKERRRRAHEDADLAEHAEAGLLPKLALSHEAGS